MDAATSGVLSVGSVPVLSHLKVVSNSCPAPGHFVGCSSFDDDVIPFLVYLRLLEEHTDKQSSVSQVGPGNVSQLSEWRPNFLRWGQSWQEVGKLWICSRIGAEGKE